jgi:ribosomal protein S18 acetylase RimI-like enzyme
MSTITFHKATLDDVDAYLALEKTAIPLKVYSGIADAQEAKEEIETNEVYLIKKDGVIVGSTEYQMQEPGHAYMSGLVIDPDFQGQGIGRRAVEFRLDQLKDMKRIYLVTHPHNSRVICMYLSYGFIIESWKDDYFGDGEPRIVLALNR